MCVCFSKFRISLVFGIVTVVSGMIGVPTGMFLSNWLKPVFPQVDPLICGAGLVGSAVLLVFVFTVASQNVYACFVLIFFAEFLISLNWSVANDITLVRKLLTC